MKPIRVLVAFTLALGLSAVAVADEMKMPEMKPSPAFDQLKTLVGSWEGQTPDGKTTTVSYQVVSAGTCVMETLHSPDGADMITMYHMDGGRVVMDHYCAINNVPHMKCTASADGRKLDFAFAGATNMASPKDTHMHGLKLSFEDADHFTQEWSLHDQGKVQPVVFHFQRVKS